MLPDKNKLSKLANSSMPYGKYRGVNYIDLPEYYVSWYYSNGLPNSEVGQLLGLLYEIKLNGLEYLVYKLKLN